MFGNAPLLERVLAMMKSIMLLFFAIIVDYVIFTGYFSIVNSLFPTMDIPKAILLLGGYGLMMVITFLVPLYPLVDLRGRYK